MSLFLLSNPLPLGRVYYPACTNPVDIATTAETTIVVPHRSRHRHLQRRHRRARPSAEYVSTTRIAPTLPYRRQLSPATFVSTKFASCACTDIRMHSARMHAYTTRREQRFSSGGRVADRRPIQQKLVVDGTDGATA